MGVPSFFRWLVGKYPKSVVQAIDEGESCDNNSLNPNGEFDNLYLDMNGIVHPCFHPEDELFGPSTLDEVFIAIFKYIDCLFRIVRPRKLLFIAVDGVAPRAKMNQQRARRFKTAKDAETVEFEEKRLKNEFEKQGKELLPMKGSTQLFDSNVITPGTAFMHKLSLALEYYIRLRLNSDPSWKSIMVILSDANVPGEGEHKIMSFIRLQRSLSGYDCSTRHCIYGLDADLIMLALATHEIHFSVLREDVLKQIQEVNISAFISSTSKKEQDIFKTREWFTQSETSPNFKSFQKKPYQFINIWTLREYLELDMSPESESVTDIERIVDDFIFICFFSGNDFLPHLPSIDIHEGGINLLIDVYKKKFKSMGGYLVDTSRMNQENTAYINFQRVKIFIIEVGSYEEKIFTKRYTLRKKKLEKLLREQNNDDNDQNDYWNSKSATQGKFNCKFGASEQILDSFSEKCNISSSVTVEASGSIESDVVENTKEFKRMLKQFLQDKSDLFKGGIVDNDKVKLGCLGWKERYYKEKFSAENPKEVEAIRTVIVQKYVEGLCWVLKYYFTGVCSWSWYYPFHYGPFVSDLKDIRCSKVSFTVGKPFEPFDQLMAVLPPRSAHALPKAYRSLMNNDDSPILNFYPIDFKIDNDGKRFTWQGVCKLPFIDELLLLEATRMLRKELQDDEVERNCIGNSKAFFMDSNSHFTQFSLHTHVSENYPKETQNHVIVGPSCGLYCFLSLDEWGSASSSYISPVFGMDDIPSDISRCAKFFIQEPQKHITRLLSADIPEKTVQLSDIVQRMLWHEYPGHFPPCSLQPQRYSPQILQSPANDTWKGAGQGWGGAGRGKSVTDAPLSGEHEPPPIFPASNMNWKVQWNTTSTNYGRGQQFSTVPSVSASTSYNKFRTMANRSNNWSQRPELIASNDAWRCAGKGWGADAPLSGMGNEHKLSPTFPASNLNWKVQYGRGHSSTVPSVSAPTSYNKFQALANRSDNRSQRPESIPVQYGRGHLSNVPSVSSTSYNKFQALDDRSDNWSQRPESVAVQYGRGNKFQAIADRSDNWSPRPESIVSNWGRGRGRGRGAPISNNYGNQSLGRGHQNAQWVPRNTEHTGKSSVSVPTNYGCEGNYPLGDGGRGRR